MKTFDRKLYRAAYYQKHKAEEQERRAQWRRNNREKTKVTRLQWLYGVTYEWYQSQLAKQNNACAICLKPASNKLFCVDHNHHTGEVRGLLCPRCNLALGIFQDDIAVLNKAIQYLTTP